MLKIIVFGSLFVAHCFVSSEIIFDGFDDKFKPEWWQSDIIYQVYVRSFKDSNGDGIGDINGIAEKVDYFKSINVGAVWLSPIYKSPQDDFGYDISSYKEIDPLFGTMKDFERLRGLLHSNDIKLILDFVPNHTSDEHPWFQNSVKKIEPYTNYYVWKNPINGTDGKPRPPNNWLGVFNKGSAWKWNEERQQYYYHAFQRKQPDLNYRNPMVVEEIKNTISYWLGRGVDGFRFDAVNYIYEREDLLDEDRSYIPGIYESDYDYLNHTSTLDQPETYEMVKIWRKLLDTETDDYTAAGVKSKFFMVECYSPLNKVMGYYGNETTPGAHFPFNFLFVRDLSQQSDAYAVNDMIKSWIKNMPKNMWPNWVIGNHDQPRMASRISPMLVDGLHMMQLLLPGTPITYYGDELGIQNTYVRWDQTVDPAGRNVGPLRYTKFSRDPVRSPFPWDDSKNAGFTNGSKTWLPVNPDYWQENLAALSKTKSHLKTYRQLTRLRKMPSFIKGNLHTYVLSKWVFGFSRSFYDHPTFFVIINFGSEIENVDIKSVRKTLPDIMKVKVSSTNSGYVTGNLLRISNILLRPKASLVLSTSRLNEDSYK
ncbi:Glycoside hydrolase superfamily,Glycosyl hydrolase, family 13, catalytic domain [Cinara cedri]|uniref:alpha-glucosidase n=1 Tax=Cinara cedri TaxID=506608 RepID=A0A5E4MF21_9HEMI|nr:Glycoside hydrolase superfamily,Glycosyl hydrolase, family 13, catalytic domain [Cinara cedri]